MGKHDPIVAGDEAAEAAAEIAGLIARARAAQAEIEHESQERVDELIRAMVWSVARPGSRRGDRPPHDRGDSARQL